MPEYKIYCYETCTRDQAKAPSEDGDAYWIHVPTDEIMRYLWPDPEEKLPRGAEYVRRVANGSIDKSLSTLAVANCEADLAEGKYDNWQAKPKPPIGGSK